MTDAAGPPTTHRYTVTVGPRVLAVELAEGEDGLTLRVDGGEAVPVRVRRPRDDELHAVIWGERAFSALVEGRERAYTVVLDGVTFDVDVQDERAARLASATAMGRQGTAETAMQAPMPGLVVAVHVEAGQQVTKGMSLIVLQAMKMENELTAREDARVKEVLVSAGQPVEQGQTLVTLE